MLIIELKIILEYYLFELVSLSSGNRELYDNRSIYSWCNASYDGTVTEIKHYPNENHPIISFISI